MQSDSLVNQISISLGLYCTYIEIYDRAFFEGCSSENIKQNLRL